MMDKPDKAPLWAALLMILVLCAFYLWQFDWVRVRSPHGSQYYRINRVTTETDFLTHKGNKYQALPFFQVEKGRDFRP